MPRLFTALELPASHVDALRSEQTNLASARWEKHFHLTLAYFGSIDDATAAKLEESLARVQSAAFELKIAGRFSFGPESAPRVLCAGVGEEPGLLELHKCLSETAIDIGLEREKRRFTPHVTIAQVYDADPTDVQRHLQETKELELPAFAVKEFVLFESVISDSGPLYTARKRFDLS